MIFRQPVEGCFFVCQEFRDLELGVGDCISPRYNVGGESGMALLNEARIKARELASEIVE